MDAPELSLRERNAALRELERVERQARRDGSGWPRRLHLALGRPPAKRLVTGIPEARSGLERFGRCVRDVHGLPRARQAADQWTLYVQRRLSSEEYYLYQLYLPGRRRLAESCIPRRRTLILLGRLYGLTGPDLESLLDKRGCMRRLEEAGLPTPPTLTVLENGTRPRLPPVDLFAKPARRWGGLGATAWTLTADGEYVDGERRSWTRYEVEAELEHRSRAEPIILQERLGNHGALEPFSNGTLSCARLVTCLRPDGGFDLLPPSFRMPWGSAVVDNFARGGLLVPVELATGTISGPGVVRDEGCGIRAVDRHPDTGAAFAGFQLPWWDEAVGLALRAAAAFRDVPFIGWDIAFLDDGPIIVEGNAEWNSDATQLPHVLGLGDTQFVTYYLHHLSEAQAGRAAGTRRSAPRAG